MTNPQATRGKIIWLSNSANAPTGYGNQTKLFTPLIMWGKPIYEPNDKPIYDLTCFSFYGIEGGIIKNQHGITELPRHLDQYGNDIIVADMKFSRSELLISLIDPFVLEPENLKQVDWCAWVPVDCTPMSDENAHALSGSRWVWSMSRFGHEQLKHAGFNPIYVPHGIDSNAFKPIDRSKARQMLGEHLQTDLTDKFIVATVAANKGTPSRKNFWGMFMAFAEFAKSHPDAIFYVHSDPMPSRYGDHLHKYVKRFGLEDKVFFPNAYHLARNLYQEDYLNDVYNAADVFMLLSMGEGFGIPIVEAQMAGCPVIVSDGSACKELCLSGWLVGTMPCQPYDGRQGCFWHYPLHPFAVQALNAAYEARGESMYRENARQFALEYDHLHVFETYMKPAIETMLGEIRAAKPPVIDVNTIPMTRKERKQLRAVEHA